MSQLKQDEPLVSNVLLPLVKWKEKIVHLPSVDSTSGKRWTEWISSDILEPRKELQATNLKRMEESEDRNEIEELRTGI